MCLVLATAFWYLIRENVTSNPAGPDWPRSPIQLR